MKRYRAKINILEVRRSVEVDAASKSEAMEMIRRGEWDTETGAEEPERYVVTISGALEDITP